MNANMATAAHSTMSLADILEQTSGNDYCTTCSLHCRSKSPKELSVKHCHLPNKQTKTWEQADEKSAASKLGEELKRKSEECEIQRNAILQKLVVKDLKTILSTSNFTTSGNKATLIERINKMGKKHIEWVDQHLQANFSDIVSTVATKRLRLSPDVHNLFDECAIDKNDRDGRDDDSDGREYEYSPMRNSGDLDYKPCPVVKDDAPLVYERPDGRGTIDENEAFAESSKGKELTAKLKRLTMSIALLDEGADNDKTLVEWYDKIAAIYNAICHCMEEGHTGKDDEDKVKESFAPTKVAFKDACEELIHDPNTQLIVIASTTHILGLTLYGSYSKLTLISLGAFEITKIRLQKMLAHFGFDAQRLMTGVDEKIKTLQSQKRNKRPITIGSDDEGEINAEQDACDMLLVPSPLDPRTEVTFSRLKKKGKIC